MVFVRIRVGLSRLEVARRKEDARLEQEERELEREQRRAVRPSGKGYLVESVRGLHPEILQSTEME